MSQERKSVCRVVHNKNYTIVNNHICKDKRLSYKAKGIWLYAFSRPDDWKFYLCDIVNQSTDGIEKVSTGLDELEKAGYLKKERRRNDKNQFCGWDYTFFETPIDFKEMFPKRENPHIGKSQDGENPALLIPDSLPIPKEQQQTPSGDVVVFNDLLKRTGITDKDKQSIIRYAKKNKISYEEFANAITYVTSPKFEVNTTLTQAIMWALKEKPEIPDLVDENKNREFAEAAEYILHSNSWNLESLSDKVLFSSKTPNNSTTYEVKFSDVNFKVKLDQLLKQCRFTKHQRS